MRCIIAAAHGTQDLHARYTSVLASIAAQAAAKPQTAAAIAALPTTDIGCPLLPPTEFKPAVSRDEALQSLLDGLVPSNTIAAYSLQLTVDATPTAVHQAQTAFSGACDPLTARYPEAHFTAPRVGSAGVLQVTLAALWSDLRACSACPRVNRPCASLAVDFTVYNLCDCSACGPSGATALTNS